MQKKDLKQLILSHKKNNITSINLSIQGIKDIDLDDSLLEELKYFKEIDLSRNMFKKLPPKFKELTQLKRLNLSSNYFKTFPEEINSLVNLEFLDLGDTYLKTIPRSLANLKKLKFLYLKGNSFDKIPKAIFQLKNLEKLGLVNTKLSTISPEINNLKKLNSLWIGKNRIKKLPNELLKLKSLKEITLDDNPLPISKEILDYQRNSKKIFQHYTKYEQNRLEQVYESKIVIVGESQAGKTSLLNRLIYNKFYEDERKTENINIDEWHLSIEGKLLTVNLWDFGGQDILYSLHRFFLSNQCIYIVVWDSRDENKSKKIEKWFKTISKINPLAQVLLVMNKVDEHNTSLDKIYLEKIINNVNYYNISCKYDWNIDKLKKDIINIFKNNQEYIFRYKKKFLEVKKALKDSNEVYIDIDKFTRILDVNKIWNKEKEDLFNIFKTQGIFLHFPNNFRLQRYIILNRYWFIEGIYTVINWISKNKTNGSFTYSELSDIFSDSNFKYQYDTIKSFLIESLISFKIIFDYKNTFYFPNLLPYYNKDLNKQLEYNFSTFTINTKGIESESFYELLIKYVGENNIKSFWRNLIIITFKDTEVYINLINRKKIYIYIPKTSNNSINEIVEFIIEDFKVILNRKDIDANVLLEDKTQVQISYLRYLLKCGYQEYISLNLNTYKIEDIFGKIKLAPYKEEKNIYINIEKIDTLDGDIFGNNSTKNLN